MEAVPKLLRLTAIHSGQLVNLAELGGRLGLNRLTAGRYLALLEQLFLVERVPAWHASEFRRMVKAPKLHAVDTGLMCALAGNHPSEVAPQSSGLRVAAGVVRPQVAGRPPFRDVITFPGSAITIRPSSTTNSPFTNTWSIPVECWCGCVNVAWSVMVSRSKTTRSAQ